MYIIHTILAYWALSVMICMPTWLRSDRFLAFSPSGSSHYSHLTILHLALTGSSSSMGWVAPRLTLPSSYFSDSNLFFELANNRSCSSNNCASDIPFVSGFERVRSCYSACIHLTSETVHLLRLLELHI